MKKLILFLLAAVLLAGCGNEKNTAEESSRLKQENWSAIEKNAAGKTVRLFMWGGDPGVNQYIDKWVKPALKKEKNVTLERVPMDTPEILQKLMNEKRAGQEKGTVDIVWLNGENFKNAQNEKLLFGPITTMLPNYKSYYDGSSSENQYDFGTKTNGYEAPWGKVQFVFNYDSSKVKNPPKTVEELKEWIKANPGKFAYPDPKDFTGNAFLRMLFYDSAGGADSILKKGYDEPFAEKNSQKLWSGLNEIEPYLWKKGKLYPNSLAELDRLYQNGEVWMTMGYNDTRAESMIEKNIFPASTKSFVLDAGSIGNKHFLAVPYNSAKKEAALTAINFLESPEAQVEKLSPAYWGENMALDYAKLPEKLQKKADSYRKGPSVLPAETLKKAFVPEVDARYVNWLKENWQDEVVQK
ncbi:ABC transporter substrate-binding protein [Metabacillus sp. GX 13764]|uniref:ABC transporter substrate-binding protein n=1 Tax=Metabacillus kandeliae TaxID=2900151 RepID=UPI001E4E5A64|nr:ABC transporter substrate-binding protein [Metabacillus kandeliae]MCD7032651.1 ABC transporter substrate-binding protein [Metabacillus kandeliae]